MQRVQTCLVKNTFSSTFIEKYANTNTATRIFYWAVRQTLKTESGLEMVLDEDHNVRSFSALEEMQLSHLTFGFIL